MNLDAHQVGGFAKSPFQYDASFISWGNIETHNPISENQFEYNWGDINTQEPWYVDQVYGNTQGSQIVTNLGLAHDVVNKICGGKWRMPKSEDFIELINNCDFVQADGATVIDESQTDKRVTVNGVVGIYLKSKINGNLLFIACSGLGTSQNWTNKGVSGNYWSTSIYNTKSAYSLVFSMNNVDKQHISSRYVGFSVRPVFDDSI